MDESIFRFTYDKISSTITIWIIFVLCIIGIISNFIAIFIAFKLKDRIANLSYQIILALIVSDLASTLSIFSMFVAYMIEGYTVLTTSSYYCPIFGATLILMSGISTILIAYLGLERYLAICIGKRLPSFISWVFFAILFLLLLVPSVIVSINNNFEPDPTYSHCFPIGSFAASFENSLLKVILTGSIITLTFCYVSIFIHCSRYEKYFSSETNQRHHEAKLSRKVAIRAIIFLAVYYICYIPKLISYFIANALKQPVPSIVNILSPTGLGLTFVLNPVLAILLHKQFRDEASNIFYSILCRFFPDKVPL